MVQAPESWEALCWVTAHDIHQYGADACHRSRASGFALSVFQTASASKALFKQNNVLLFPSWWSLSMKSYCQTQILQSVTTRYKRDQKQDLKSLSAPVLGESEIRTKV